ncbi:MAG TPA: hypothetical protein VMK12_32560, partial [Anaeromyxobacteraceae bacterium]|nr:hypothetical protein [Anaeromyxobacteraceae bacterium]
MLEMMGKAAPDAEPSKDAIQVIIQSGHAGAVTAVALSPDGRSVLSGGMDESLKLWDTASRSEARSFAGRALAWPTAIAFSRDGARFTVSDAESTRIYDRVSGAQLLYARAMSWPLLIAADGGTVVGPTPMRGPPEMLVIDTASTKVLW